MKQFKSNFIIGIDHGYGNIKTANQPVSHLCKPDAILVRAPLWSAKERGAKAISVVSRSGGYSKEVSDACVLIPVVADERITPHAEGWQGVIWHLMVNALNAEQ